MAGLSAGVAEAEGRLRLELEAAAAALRVDMVGAKPFGFVVSFGPPSQGANDLYPLAQLLVRGAILDYM